MGKYYIRNYKPVSGIYKITNKISGEFYIGASSNIGRRFIQHLGSSDLKIQQDIQELGPEHFTFEILERTKELNTREKFWITSLNPEYNKKV